jgi:hypothetical protein
MDCFQGKDIAKGKHINKPGWFKAVKQNGPQPSPLIFWSFMEFLQAL